MLKEITPERNGKTIEVSIFVVLNKKGQFLYEKRPISEEYLGGYNIFPGGKAEKGETTLTTLFREFKEETGGARIKKCYYLGSSESIDNRGTLFHDAIFLVTDWEGNINNPTPQKGVHHWANTTELRETMKLNFSQEILSMVEEFISSGKVKQKRG